MNEDESTRIDGGDIMPVAEVDAETEFEREIEQSGHDGMTAENQIPVSASTEPYRAPTDAELEAQRQARPPIHERRVKSSPA